MLRSLTLPAIALALVVLAPAVASADQCLRWDDIQSLNRQGKDAVLARSAKGDFLIKFKAACPYQRTPANYFIVDLYQRSECVRTIGALKLNEAGTCFITGIDEVPPSE
jgi:hypothetical protein